LLTQQSTEMRDNYYWAFETKNQLHAGHKIGLGLENGSFVSVVDASHLYPGASKWPYRASRKWPGFSFLSKFSIEFVGCSNSIV
jgi:hypothetical protein